MKRGEAIDDCRHCAGVGRVFDFDDGDTLCSECQGTGLETTEEEEGGADVEV